MERVSFSGVIQPQRTFAHPQSPLFVGSEAGCGEATLKIGWSAMSDCLHCDINELASGPLDAETLAARVALHLLSARDFLDALVALGMLNRDGDRYANTQATDLFLARRKPSYVGGFLEMANARLYPFWGSLTEALRTGEPQNEAKHGGDLFESLYADPERLARFLGAMSGISMGSGRAIAAKFPWRDYKSFADIGTAEGGL